MDCRIVIVDDETLCLKNVKNMLSDDNMKVNCLRSGKDLLKYVEHNSPDLILLDIMMPEMDGFETLQALRRYEDDQGRPHIPVIFLTGENGSVTEQKGLRLGASDYIRKPIDKDVLLRRIFNILKNRKTIESLTEEAMYDRLTGFLNKFHGTERISEQCRNKTGSLIIIDLDNFKLVNDLFGHDMGDRTLVLFSDIVREGMRESDIVSRIGGDEFMAFCESLTEETEVKSLADRLNTRLDEEMDRLLGTGHGIPIGISLGCVFVPEYGRDYEELFVMADAAMYMVKQNGKHGYRIGTHIKSIDGSEHTDPKQKLDRIVQIVEERSEPDTAMLLGMDSFALIYRYVMRLNRNYGRNAALILISLSSHADDGGIGLAGADKVFVDVLTKTLAISDLILQSSSNDFIILLTNRSEPETEGVLQSIIDCWEETGHGKNIKIDHAIKYIEG